MKTISKGRIIIAWIATIAILLTVLAPSFSYGLEMQTRAAPWAEICAAGAPKTVDAPRHTEPHQKNIHTLKHCPFCFQNDNHDAPPPAGATLPAAPTHSDILLSMLSYQASRSLAVRSANNPRAPPQTS